MSVGVNGNEHSNVDVNLQQFFDQVFDASGHIVERNGCDTAYYLSKLEKYAMSESDKVELIQVLWNSIDSVLRIQFGFDSLTHIMNEKAAMRAQNDLSVVQLGPIQNEKTEGA